MLFDFRTRRPAAVRISRNSEGDYCSRNHVQPESLKLGGACFSCLVDKELEEAA